MKRNPGAAAAAAETETIATAPTLAPPGLYVHALPIAQLRESPMNPRKRFPEAGLAELAASIREKGVITPLLVRPVERRAGEPDGPDRYDIAAGHRRRRACLLAGVAAVPAVVRTMTDAEFLEVLVTENDQREDVHPLEEASGYQALIRTAGYDVGRIAARVGRSVKYVYDRLKLLELVPEAQRLFLEGRFTAGHAILLARLSAEDQKRAIAINDDGYSGHRDNLFTEVCALPFEDDEAEKRLKADPYLGHKAMSVREFEAWIQREVKFDRERADPMLFPETAEELERAEIEKLQVIPITREYIASDAVRKAANGKRIYGEQAWKRADGRAGSKPCDSKRVGLVACGPGQGEAFRVCIDKEKCATHWAAWQKDRRARQKAVAGASTAGGKDVAKEALERHEREEKAHLDRERVDKALPAVMAAIAAAVRKAPAGSSSQLGRTLFKWMDGDVFYAAGGLQRLGIDLVKIVPIGTRAEDLVRHLSFRLLAQEISDEVIDTRELVKRARAFGVDAKAILDRVAPAEAAKPAVQTSAKPGKPKRGICRKCGCQENTPCAGGCGWADATQTRCTACFRPKLKSRAKKAK